MIRQEVIRAYRKVPADEVMNATEIAGKYLEEYPSDALSCIIQDIADYQIPRVIGEQVKLIIRAVVDSEQKES